MGIAVYYSFGIKGQWHHTPWYDIVLWRSMVQQNTAQNMEQKNRLINVIRTYWTGYMSRIWTIYITNLDISRYISGRCVFPIRTRTMVVLVINGLLHESKWHAMRAQGGKWHNVTFQSTITQYNLYIHNFPARNKLHIWTIRVYISAAPFIFRIIIMQNINRTAYNVWYTIAQIHSSTQFLE